MGIELSAKQNEYSVYMHVNKTNGKRYIGITKQNPERRWQKGCGYADNPLFWNAIKKYGWEGFDHIILADGLTKENACEIEIALIATHKSNDREYGYNIADGGQTCDGLRRYGAEHPNHQRVKMIDSETKKVLRIFGAQSEAARIMGISRKGITKACQGKGTATYMGYIWEYADKDYEKPGNPGAGNYDHKKIRKPIKMIDVDGSIHEYESIKAAGEALEIRSNTIARYLSGVRTDRSGRRWCYA